MAFKARRIPLRLATGAFILNSGLGKLSADEGTAKQLHGFATGTYPFLGKLDDQTFVKTLARGEIALGALLLVPVVPVGLAGLALTGFSAGLLGMYLKTPGLRKEGSLAPTPDGLAISKDVWMLGTGLGLLVDAWTERKK